MRRPARPHGAPAVHVLPARTDVDSASRPTGRPNGCPGSVALIHRRNVLPEGVSWSPADVLPLHPGAKEWGLRSS